MYINTKKGQGAENRAVANAVSDRGKSVGKDLPSVPQHAPDSMPFARLPAAGRPQTLGKPGVVQGMFGFEFELHIVLSQGMASGGEMSEIGKETDQSGFVPTTIEYLNANVGKPKVETTTHKVVVKDTVYEWIEDSKDEGEGVIRPKTVEKGEAGRWHKKGTFTGAETDEALYFDPLLKKEDKIFNATEAYPVNVVEDHASTALDARLSSIPEFVTEPRDEFDERGMDYVLQPVVAAQKLAQAIEAQTKNRKIRVPAKTVFPNTRPDLYFGINHLGGTNDQKPAASVQATAAVELSQVPTFLEQSSKALGVSEDDRSILNSTLSSAQNILSKLDLSDKNTLGIGALIHLIAQYLTGGAKGHPTDKANVKNNALFLIRPPLTEIIDQMLKEAPEEVKKLLERGYVTGNLIPKILEISNRKPEEPVFKTHNPKDKTHGKTFEAWRKDNPTDKEKPGTPPTTQEWLEGLFLGIKTSLEEKAPIERQDLIRDYSRFSRARKLPLEDVGPPTEARKKGVPLEARQVNAPGTGATDVPIASWMVIAKQYYEMLRGLNSPKEEVVGEKLGGLPSGTKVKILGNLEGEIMGQGKDGHYKVKLGTNSKEMDIAWSKVTKI